MSLTCLKAVCKQTILGVRLKTFLFEITSKLVVVLTYDMLSSFLDNIRKLQKLIVC